MYHAGTLFRDAASKYIHTQNEESLCAGETIVAMKYVEYWLCEEILIAVKRYHSDNGIFTAELFKEACAEDSQIQSLSGVGAQHHNLEAK